MRSDFKDKTNIYSMNCQGLRNNNKRKDVINYLKSQSMDILCLQDTENIRNKFIEGSLGGRSVFTWN